MTGNDEIQILLVEDNPRDAELTMHALKKRNLTDKLVWAHDGAEALAVIFGPHSDAGRHVFAKPKVILLDLKMPKVGGLEVLRQLKADVATRNIPVVVLTSSREEQDLLTCYELGVNSYIVKPVDFESFCEAVTQVGLYWLLLNQPMGK
ncbi:MAG: response regulator [Verrucomicrobiia bacterium]|jgi:CheY-like chemotaxis protein